MKVLMRALLFNAFTSFLNDMVITVEAKPFYHTQNINNTNASHEVEIVRNIRSVTPANPMAGLDVLNAFSNAFNGIAGLATAGQFIYGIIEAQKSNAAKAAYQKAMINTLYSISTKLSTISNQLTTMEQQLTKIQQSISGLLLDPSLNAIKTYGDEYYVKQGDSQALHILAIAMVDPQNTRNLFYHMDLLHNNIMGTSTMPSLLSAPNTLVVYPLIRIRLLQALQLMLFSCMELLNDPKYKINCDTISMMWSKRLDAQIAKVAQLDHYSTQFVRGNRQPIMNSKLVFSGVEDSAFLSTLLNPTMTNGAINVGRQDTGKFFPKPVISCGFSLVNNKWLPETGKNGESSCVHFDTMKISGSGSSCNLGVGMLASFMAVSTTPNFYPLGITMFYMPNVQTQLANIVKEITFGTNYRNMNNTVYLGAALGYQNVVNNTQPIILGIAESGGATGNFLVSDVKRTTISIVPYNSISTVTGVQYSIFYAGKNQIYIEVYGSKSLTQNSQTLYLDIDPNTGAFKLSLTKAIFNVDVPKVVQPLGQSPLQMKPTYTNLSRYGKTKQILFRRF